MALLENILADIKSCMKEGEKTRLTCLRGIHSDIKNLGINQKLEITDSLVIEAVSKGVKQRKDAAEQFAQGGRQDLVEANLQEIKWLEKYLPAQLGEEELKALVAEAISETGAASKKDLGKVMGYLMPKTKGRADGKLLSQLVNAQLG